jgi:hypothetical protein
MILNDFRSPPTGSFECLQKAKPTARWAARSSLFAIDQLDILEGLRENAVPIVLQHFI